MSCTTNTKTKTKACLCLTVGGALALCTLGVGVGAAQAKGKDSKAAPPDLLSAYKKEFAFLEAQKRALEQRLAALAKHNARTVAAAEAKVNALQVQLIGLRGKADGAERDLRAAERKLPADDDGDRLADTLERARASLAKLGLKLPAAKKGDTDAQAAALQRAFEQAAPALAQLGAVRVTPGHFFISDGSRVSGKLVHVGAVATFGISNDGRHAGGLIGWVIVVLGLAALAMILGRVLILGVAAARGRGLADAFESLVRMGRLDEARSAARRAGGSIGRVLRATLDGIELPREQLEDRVSEAMLAEQPRL
ncbi:MAG: hypothetical protein KC503_38565, partial [Myxococcales bacterium]|nr:hypothetical protein [Myxococcales bacterium]